MGPLSPLSLLSIPHFQLSMTGYQSSYIQVRSAMVTYDADSVYGTRSGFQEMLVVTSMDKNSVLWCSFSIAKSFVFYSETIGDSYSSKTP